MPSKDQTRAKSVGSLHPLTQAIALVALGFVFLASLQAAPAFAAGPIGYDDEDAGANESLARAIKMVDRGSYATAITLLKKAIESDPSNPDAYSLMGFSQRKLGEWEAALSYYTKALELDPKHLGANEYLGELYLEMDDLEGAEERLNVLEAACGRNCAEYLQLKEAVAAFKAGG